MSDETRLKRLRFRAWRRGFREADLILGPFADLYCPTLTGAQVAAFEVLLDLPDHDVYGWIIGREPAPPEYDTDLLALIRDFHLSARLARRDGLGA